METVATRRRRPADIVDLRQRAFAYGLAMLVLSVTHGAVDGRKPLRRVAKDERRLRSPGVRIAVDKATARDQRTHFGKLVDDAPVRVAFLAVRLDDDGAAEEREILAERAVFKHVVCHRQAMLQPDLVVVIAMRRRGVHKPGASLRRYVVAIQERYVKVPFPVVCMAPEGMRTGDGGEFRDIDIRETPVHRGVQPSLRERRLGQVVGDEIQVADFRPALLRTSRDFVEPVADVGSEADGPVLRDGPWRRRPDDDLRAFQAR